MITFNIPWGKYTWLIQAFGLSVYSDISQERLNQVFRLVPEITGITFHVLATGIKKEHDATVQRLCKTTRMSNIMFNMDKI